MIAPSSLSLAGDNRVDTTGIFIALLKKLPAALTLAGRYRVADQGALFNLNVQNYAI